MWQNRSETEIIHFLLKCVFRTLPRINYPTFRLRRSIIIHDWDPSTASKCFVQFSGHFCSWRFSILSHENLFLQSISEHFSAVLHRGEAIPRRMERDGKRGVSTFTDENVYLFFQKSKPLKKIFTKKESVYSGSQQLRAAEGSLVTRADVMGGKISIAAEGQSGPKMPVQLLHFSDMPISNNPSAELL